MSKLPEAVAITGSIGSGKSTLLSLLQDQGCEILSLDLLNATLLEPFEKGFNSLIHFDPELLKKTDNQENPFILDKPLLANKMFSNPEYKRIIEAILHPMLIEKMNAWIELSLKSNPERPCFVEIPLLFETGLDKEFQTIWFVDVNADTRLERLMKERGMEKEQAQKVMNSQMSDEIKRAKSSLVFENNGKLENLKCQLEKALKEHGLKE